MKILLIGQTSLHWGRMEFGNMGNYYIIEPFIRELHNIFPNVEILTTLQMSKRFCETEKVTVLPLELYYGFNGCELDSVKKEYDLLLQYEQLGVWKEKTPYIEAVLDADIVIDLSGDMWGDNADLAGENRFLVGLYKDRIAQKLRPTFMLAGSPGPFDNAETVDFAKEVFGNFKIVTNREKASRDVLKRYNFKTENILDCACPSFLFEPKTEKSIYEKVKIKMKNPNRKVVGFILCGWNFKEGPFSKWPREENEFLPFIQEVEYLSERLGVNVILLSHSNGFPIPPQEFELQHGRDYVVVEKLKELVDKRGIAQHVYLQNEVWDAWTTKGFISSLDMLVSGRIHGAVAGLSQNVPTVIYDYGHGPQPHKLKGIAQMIGVQEYLVDGSDVETTVEVMNRCWQNREEIRKKLEKAVPKIKMSAKKNFYCIKEYLENNYI